MRKNRIHTERKWGNIEEQEVLNLFGFVSAENGGLNGGSVGDSFVGVDGLVEFFAVEVVLEELLDLGDSSGSSDQNDVVDSVLVDSGVTERFLHGVEGATEEVRAELFESRTGDRSVEIDT